MITRLYTVGKPSQGFFLRFCGVGRIPQPHGTKNIADISAAEVVIENRHRIGVDSNSVGPYMALNFNLSAFVSSCQVIG